MSRRMRGVCNPPLPRRPSHLTADDTPHLLARVLVLVLAPLSAIHSTRHSQSEGFARNPRARWSFHRFPFSLFADRQPSSRLPISSKQRLTIIVSDAGGGDECLLSALPITLNARPSRKPLIEVCSLSLARLLVVDARQIDRGGPDEGSSSQGDECGGPPLDAWVPQS